MELDAGPLWQGLSVVKIETRSGQRETIKTAPGGHLTVHYEVMTGENFELEVRDGNNVNASIVTVVNASSGVNQAVLPATSSGHEFYIRFRYTGRMGTSVKFLITDDKVLSFLMLSNVTFTNNSGRGVTLSNITGHIAISNALVYKNRADGVSGMRIFGTVTTSYLHLFDNRGEGLRIENSSFLTCDFHNLFAKENSRNGFHLQDVSLKCNIENAKFDSNGYNGLEVDRGAGNIGIQNATAILNGKGGVLFVNGKASSRLVSCDLSQNKEVGCYIWNQGGSHQLSNSSINYNLLNGVVVFQTGPYYWDMERHFHLTDAFSMVNCVMKSNGQYGLLIDLKCNRLRESFVDVARKIEISDNQIQRNERGGVRLYLNCWLWFKEKEKTRKVLALVSGNVFQENSRSAFLMKAWYLHSWYHAHIMDAVIASNHFINNSGAVFVLEAGYHCFGAKKPSKPLQIKNNVFTKNRVTENVLSVDVRECWYSEARRSVAILNNTFEDNQLTTKDRFPSFYHRTTSRAVLVLNGGRFILHENTFENHAFPFETSTLDHDPGHVIDARFNWWGSTNECDIADRIFDYRRRAQLSLLEFFPYMVSKNKSLHMNLTILRPSCFLRNRTIGGILDRPLYLPSEDNGYEVRDDIIILTNGSLVIPGNTTLYFPSRSVMVAQGSLIVDGHETAKVKFVKKNPTKSFRLASGPGPWEGRIEFLINGTWMPMCFPHNQSSHEEASVVCQQLDLYYQRSYVKPSIKSAGGFVYNVECNSHIDADIMSCNREKWSYQTTCWENNVYVKCGQYNWAGLHLTVSKYHSTLHHLEIHDAGLAYRSYIYVPGVALRIDLNHHNISNVYINGSDGVGIQFLYQSVFQRMPVMPKSVVSHTKLHGIHTFYPLSLTDMDLMSNDIGFLFTTLEYHQTMFSLIMASPGMTQTFHFCSKNKTYLEANGVFVFSLEALADFEERDCFHIMQTEPGYKLVFQVLDFPLHSFMTVYDGLNISAKVLWTVSQSSYWNDRSLFNSSRSVVLFRGRYRGYYGRRRDTVFLVSTIKEFDEVTVKNIYRSKDLNLVWTVATAMMNSVPK
ncbi:protein bark beetle-like [Montipora capricornis]|uniref:protein bark beetle-like n=1 Tax=Montipora capricornis TaxID=246305 RepID=UPI0035F1AA8D